MKIVLLLIVIVLLYCIVYLFGTFNIPFVCQNQYVIQNKRLCQSLGCTWGTGVLGNPSFCGRSYLVLPFPQ